MKLTGFAALALAIDNAARYFQGAHALSLFLAIASAFLAGLCFGLDVEKKAKAEK